MSTPWAPSGARYFDDLDMYQCLYADARAKAISAGRDPQTDEKCVPYALKLHRAKRSLLSHVFTMDNIFFANLPHTARWVGGPSRNLLQSINSLADPSRARTFPHPPCLSCMAALLSASQIPPSALDECRGPKEVYRCPRCSRRCYATCRRISESASASTMAILTTAFRSELGGSHIALPMLFRSEVGTSDQARRLLILAMYSEHRRACWAEYLRSSPGTGAEPVPRPGSDVDALILEQERREPRLVAEINDDGE